MTNEYDEAAEGAAKDADAALVDRLAGLEPNALKKLAEAVPEADKQRVRELMEAVDFATERNARAQAWARFAEGASEAALQLARKAVLGPAA